MKLIGEEKRRVEALAGDVQVEGRVQ